MAKIIIETIPILPFGMLNAFLIIQGQNAILVDTGLPHSEPKIEKALKKYGLNWSNIRLIVLTHAHIDHAGSAVAIRELTGAPILGHEADFTYYKGEAPRLNTTGFFGRMFQKTGAIERPFAYFTPDIPMTTSQIDLSVYGFSAQVLHTPGHTPGSISVLLQDGRVTAGDLASSGILLGGIALRGRPKRPPFEEDSDVTATSLETLLSQGCNEFFLGHGGPLFPDAIQSHIVTLRKCGASGIR